MLHQDFDPMAHNELHDKGPWTVSDDGRGIESDDFNHDVILHVTGDFYSDEQRKAYSENLAAKLNAPKEIEVKYLVSNGVRTPGRWFKEDET